MARSKELSQLASRISVDDVTQAIVLPNDTRLGSAKLPPVNLTIAPEVLEIQVASTEAGDDITWFWTWLTSSLPYARINITNSPQLTVPLYKKGTYTLNNFAAYETFADLTQVHPAYLKWVDGAGTDNVVSWATYVQTSHSHPDINGGNSTQVQRFSINVPEVVTPPTLTLPVGIGYDVSFSTPGAYTFGANMMHGGDVNSVADGDNPNIGPMYRGATYTFHLDSSLSGHPFYITTDNGQGFVAGQYVGEYTDGVVGSRNNGSAGQETLTFTVPLDAPDNLYYQCAWHGAMRGVITIKDLAVEVNNNGNYVLYFQHTHEGHKTPIEIRPIPSLVNQMCLVYDQSTGQFVPQDLATYVENTPSFKNKIQEVAGTATLVAPDGTSLVASVKIFQDASYLPFSGNVAGDIAYTQDNNTMFIWDEVQYNWISTKAKSTTEITEGTNLYFTNARVGTYLSNNGFDTAANIVASIVDTAPATLDTLNELAAALGDDPNFATTVTTALGTKLNSADFDSTFDTRLATKSTDDIAEGSNLYYTDARAQAAITVNSTLSKTGGQISLPSSGVTAATYGSASAVPVFTVDSYGRITSATTTNVAGVSGFSYTAATNTYTITTSAGTTFDASGDLSSFDTADLAEGTNLYWTTARGESMFDTRLATKTTSDLAEGTNLYFTTGRARASISATGSLSYDSTTGVMSFTLPALDTDTVTEGTNLYFTTARAQGVISTSGGLLTYGSGVVGLTAEAIQDVIGAMVSNNTESAISVTYNDTGNALDFAVDTATIATRTYVDDAIASLIDSAPGTLTTLSEIAAALGDDPNFASTITTQLTTKADKATIITAGTGLTGGGDLSTGRTISHADTSSQVSVDNSGNTFIQDITLDGFGHITGIASGTVVVGDGAMAVTAGSGLTGGGQLGTANQSGATSVTISHADTSSVANLSSDNANGVVIQDVALTFDTYGHVQTATVSTVDLDGRYYTEGESDSKFHSTTSINVSRNIVSGTNLDTDLDNGGAYSSYGAGGTSWNAPFSYGGVLGYSFTSGIRGQIAFDIRHNQTNYGDFWVRSKNNLGYTPWAKVWHNLNDGSGSGLDADTVDGVHASSFSRYYEQSTNPGAVSNGSMWYNTATDKTYMRQGGAWVQVSPSSSGIGIYDVNGTKVN